LCCASAAAALIAATAAQDALEDALYAADGISKDNYRNFHKVFGGVVVFCVVLRPTCLLVAFVLGFVLAPQRCIGRAPHAPTRACTLPAMLFRCTWCVQRCVRSLA
jgi:hypothetical protein